MRISIKGSDKRSLNTTPSCNDGDKVRVRPVRHRRAVPAGRTFEIRQPARSEQRLQGGGSASVSISFQASVEIGA